MKLDYEIEEFRGLLHRTADSIADLYAGLEQRKIVQATEPNKVRAMFREPLPEHPEDPVRLIERVENQVFETATLHIRIGFANPAPKLTGPEKHDSRSVGKSRGIIKRTTLFHFRGNPATQKRRCS